MGEFDTNILCAKCDRRLGLFDEYAIKYCAALSPTTWGNYGVIYRQQPFDGAAFAKAVLAILWRASISQREAWRSITLGPHADAAARILFESTSLSSLPAFEVVLLRYVSGQHDTRKFIFNPLRIRSGDLNAFAMGIGGFLVVAKVDQRPMHRRLSPYVINSADTLKAPIIPFEDTAEYAYLQKVADTDRKRRATTCP